MAYYHVRISPKRANPTSDLVMFMNEMEITGEGKWDQDFQGKMATGDYLGFIIGKTGNEMVHIFKVKETLPLSEREPWWNTNHPYTDGNGINAPVKRVPLILTNDHNLPKTWAWQDIKEKVGLAQNCSSWMPRGTQRIIATHLLPFALS